MITSNYTNEQRYEIANVIWQRLGSQKFSLLTGCKHMCYGEKDGNVFLLMSVGKNIHSINLFEVLYDEGKDLYDVRFMRKVGNSVLCVADYSDVSCDMLHTLFEQYTGISVNFNVAA